MSGGNGARSEPDLNRAADDLDLPRPPGALRGLMRENPRWVDGAIVAIYVIAVAGFAVLGAYIPEDFDPESNAPMVFESPSYFVFPEVLLLALIVVVTIAAILLRRRYPLVGLIGLLIALIFPPDQMVPAAASTLAIVVLLYSTPVYRSVRAGWLGYVIAVAASLLPIPFMSDVISAEVNTTTEVLQVGVTSSLLLVIPLLIGINAGNRRRYTEAIIDRAHQLARERDQRARLAVAEERTRIAREMHDIVAHSVSVMVTLSEGAARVIDAAPEDARSAIEQSAETGRAALTEMRHLIGALREGDDESAELAPTPGLDAIPDLIHGFRSAGLTVNLSLKGGIAGVEQRRELAIYRTIQEALTNTLRYAGAGATAEVAVAQTTDLIEVRIEDDGGGAASDSTMSGVGSGNGLTGLAERLRLVGGELEYGPTPAGGWLVAAAIPHGDDDD